MCNPIFWIKLEGTGHHFPSSANTQKIGLHVPPHAVKQQILVPVVLRTLPKEKELNGRTRKVGTTVFVEPEPVSSRTLYKSVKSRLFYCVTRCFINILRLS